MDIPTVDSVPLSAEFDGPPKAKKTSVKGKKATKGVKELPPNYTTLLSSRVPDFSSPDRPPTCLEVDFPIAPINRLAQQEGNAGKPIYQMSKWWARRPSSVFRAMLLAASTEAPPADQRFLAARQIWDAYYANHQKSGSFRNLSVLDPFMGGGTTLVEGARLGMQMRGMDLNPVAWFVVTNELAGSDPRQVQEFFDTIEAEVKPQIQPFYTTSCPRGHKGHWIAADGLAADIDPLTLPSSERHRYRWHGPEVIYTFWAKHAPCPAHEETGGYRTPVFRSPVVAQKTLTSSYLALTCSSCGHEFDAELGETRIAPGTTRVNIQGGKQFTETSQAFAQCVKSYGVGSRGERDERITMLIQMIPHESALHCPTCGTFAGETLLRTCTTHHKSFIEGKPTDSKKDLKVQRKKVDMVLLIHPDWLKGVPGRENGIDLGGFIGADPAASAAWYTKRLQNLSLIEVRLASKDNAPISETDYVLGTPPEEINASEETEKDQDLAIEGLPATIPLSDGTVIDTTVGTVPEQSTCTCAACGRQNDILTSVKTSGHSAPVAVYALQCFCPDCKREGYNYNGRFFKSPDEDDIARLDAAEVEWAILSEKDFTEYWPHEQLPFAHSTYQRHTLPGHGYTHWWTMFNPRQLLVHTQLLHAITEADPARWPLDVRMQALGAFQQYLRNQNMFCFWNFTADKMEPHFANGNYHPKALVVENCVFSGIGRGTWVSAMETTIEGLLWCRDPWETCLMDGEKKSEKLTLQDSITSQQHQAHMLFNGSSTELPFAHESQDLVITDPPFGDNVFYADLADFFYVWLRIPMRRWFAGKPEAEYFALPATPKALEAITNKAEHPDDRTVEEKKQSRRTPADEFYQRTLTMCWEEAYRVLKPGGLLAFTFHHSQDEPWINVLESLFDARFYLVATYPIRSDESKGNKGQFGSKKIEYDIIHVCRKQLTEPEEASWPHMRRWVKDEVSTLRRMLETYHKEELNEPDIRVILRGKALEFYSRHYGRVITGSGDILSIRDALIGINTLIEDMNEEDDTRPPDTAEPLTYRFLRLFGTQGELQRDALHKLLRGSTIDPSEFIRPGWLREKTGKIYVVAPIAERFQILRNKHRKDIKRDLDQAHFLIGAAMTDSGVSIEKELRHVNFTLDKNIESLLSWYAATATDDTIKTAAAMAHRFITRWRTDEAAKEKTKVEQQGLF